MPATQERRAVYQRSTPLVILVPGLGNFTPSALTRHGRQVLVRIPARPGSDPGVRVGLADMGELVLNPRSARRALQSLEAAGLIAVEQRPGRKPVIMLRRHRMPTPRDRALFLPIPWIWWYRALALPGRALRVALALWFQGGWLGNQAKFPFDLGAWESLGLTRFAAGRGLRSLVAVDLVSVEHRPGQSPVVTVLDAPIGVADRAQALAKPD